MNEKVRKIGRVFGSIFTFMISYVAFESSGLPVLVVFLGSIAMSVIFWRIPVLTILLAIFIFDCGICFLGPSYLGLPYIWSFVWSVILAGISMVGSNKQGGRKGFIVCFVILIVIAVASSGNV